MRTSTKLLVAVLLALGLAGCRFARSGSQAFEFNPFVDPPLKVLDGSGYDNGIPLDQSK